jgi:hypothetical protein
MDELLPCPFCAGTNVSVNPGENYRTEMYEAGCWDCDVWIAQDSPGNSYSRQLTEEGRVSAINNWNRRMIPTSGEVDAKR